MKQLESNYKKYGYNFRQIEREGDIAIYEQSDPETGKVYAFEIFIIQKNEASEIFGNSVEARESVPSTEKWGKEAFTTWTLKEALDKKNILKNRLTQRLANANNNKG